MKLSITLSDGADRSRTMALVHRTLLQYNIKVKSLQWEDDSKGDKK